MQNTRFNGYAVLAAVAAHTFHIGAGNDANDRITMNSTNMTAAPTMTALFSFTTPPTIPAPSGILTQVASQDVLPQIDAALTTINSERANFGAIQNRFEAVIENLQVAAENQTAARSRIMDADFAAETAALTRAQARRRSSASSRLRMSLESSDT